MNSILTGMVPMRDGCRLFTTIHFPEGQGPFPVILVRNLYRAKGSIASRQEVTGRGIALVEQDVRGSGLSEGRWEKPWIQEAEDGEDCLRWIVAQPWCNGRIAMRGGSYLGATQWFAAGSGVEALVAISPGIAPCNYHESPKYQGGAFILQQNIAWALGNWRKNLPCDNTPPMDVDKLSNFLPLIGIDQAAGLGEVPFWRTWLEHPCYDDYWRAFDLASFVDRIKAPAFIWSGWFDIYTQGALDSFCLMRTAAGSPEARALTFCVIGPWAHSEPAGEIPLGDGEFSRRRFVKEPEQAFLEARLKGVETPSMPPLRYFLLGKNEWRTAETWPPAGVSDRSFYLHSGGTANTRFGDGVLSEELPGEELPDCFLSDPRHPVPTTGGHGICVPNGSHDQSEVEERSDVLVYTSDVLKESLTIAGRIFVCLHASSTAPDTDFTAKLVDVYPDGRAFNIANGILRARYRNSMETPELLKPGEVCEYKIDLWSVANCFLPGHRIRLEIAGSDFPEFSRNNQTGRSIAEDTELRIARQTVLHDARHLSRLILPVLEESK